MPSSKASQGRHPRLDQLFSRLGYGSRREALHFLRARRFTVEGVEADAIEIDGRYDPALVRLDDEPLDHPEGLIVLLHKPVGVVCTHDEGEGRTVFELLPPRWRERTPKLVGVGRLDKETSGLYLITDQHDLVHALTSPKRHVEKTYEVTWEGSIRPDTAALFAAGELQLRGEKSPCLPARFETTGENTARVTLREGRYHQVRRMIAAVGGHCVKLHRITFGPLNLDGVGVGEMRVLPLDSFGAR